MTSMKLLQRKTPANPNHHNYNRSQPWITRFSSRLAWLSLTLKGNSANIYSSIRQLHAAIYSQEFLELPESAQAETKRILGEASTLASRCADLVEDVKILNANKRFMQ
jgi:hypothetical protein